MAQTKTGLHGRTVAFHSDKALADKLDQLKAAQTRFTNNSVFMRHLIRLGIERYEQTLAVPNRHSDPKLSYSVGLNHDVSSSTYSSRSMESDRDE